jgi:hypothetical protein
METSKTFSSIASTSRCGPAVLSSRTNSSRNRTYSQHMAAVSLTVFC